MKVHKLTQTQKKKLVGKTYCDNVFFNPTEDADGNWFISEQEVNMCNKKEFAWVNKLPKIDYKPIQYDLEELKNKYGK